MTSEPRTTVGLKNSGRFEPPRALSSAWKSTWFATRWPGVQIPQRPPLFSEDTREEAQEINRNQNGRSVEHNCLEGAPPAPLSKLFLEPVSDSDAQFFYRF